MRGFAVLATILATLIGWLWIAVHARADIPDVTPTPRADLTVRG